MITLPNPKQHTNTQTHKHTNNKHSKGRLYLTSRSRLRRFIFAFSSHVERLMSHLARPNNGLLSRNARIMISSPPPRSRCWHIVMHRGTSRRSQGANATARTDGDSGAVERSPALPLSFACDGSGLFHRHKHVLFYFIFGKKKKSEKKRKYYLIWI